MAEDRYDAGERVSVNTGVHSGKPGTVLGPYSNLPGFYVVEFDTVPTVPGATELAGFRGKDGCLATFMAKQLDPLPSGKARFTRENPIRTGTRVVVGANAPENHIARGKAGEVLGQGSVAGSWVIEFDEDLGGVDRIEIDRKIYTTQGSRLMVFPGHFLEPENEGGVKKKWIPRLGDYIVFTEDRYIGRTWFRIGGRGLIVDNYYGTLPGTIVVRTMHDSTSTEIPVSIAKPDPKGSDGWDFTGFTGTGSVGLSPRFKYGEAVRVNNQDTKYKIVAYAGGSNGSYILESPSGARFRYVSNIISPWSGSQTVTQATIPFGPEHQPVVPPSPSKNKVKTKKEEEEEEEEGDSVTGASEIKEDPLFKKQVIIHLRRDVEGRPIQSVQVNGTGITNRYDATVGIVKGAVHNADKDGEIMYEIKYFIGSLRTMGGSFFHRDEIKEVVRNNKGTVDSKLEIIRMRSSLRGEPLRKFYQILGDMKIYLYPSWLKNIEILSALETDVWTELKRRCEFLREKPNATFEEIRKKPVTTYYQGGTRYAGYEGGYDSDYYANREWDSEKRAYVEKKKTAPAPVKGTVVKRKNSMSIDDWRRKFLEEEEQIA